MLKHRLKIGLRRAVAKFGYAFGAWKLANKNGCSRVTILTLHCVGFPEGTDYLPSYMKLSEDDFDSLLDRLAISFEMVDLNEALRRLSSKEKNANSIVITLDDGYKDNYTYAYPILKKRGIPFTVFLEAGAVNRTHLSWINKYFFIDKARGSSYFAGRYAQKCGDKALSMKLAEVVSAEGNVEYGVKKIIKYDVDSVERDRITDEIFKEAGGNEQKILDGAYLSWDEVKKMAKNGVSFGCHTVTHPILSRLTKEEARKEIVDSTKLIKENAGVDVESFAFPWGRAWDYNKETIEILKEEGFSCGLAMDETSAVPGSCDRFNLSRYPLAEGFSIADILAEASGLYGLFGGKL